MNKIERLNILKGAKISSNYIESNDMFRGNKNQAVAIGHSLFKVGNIKCIYILFSFRLNYEYTDSKEGSV